MAIFNVKNLSFSYPENARGFVLSEVNFTVESGEMLLLYGASGSGKSTLLRLLKPELAPFGELKGEIFFHSNYLNDLDSRQSAAKIGYVGQNPESAAVTERVMSELAFLPQNLGLSCEDIKRKIAEISSFFGLEPIIGKQICELSGGQKQLVNLAAVMVANPEVLLLDEPCAQLDPLAAERFISLVGRIRRELGTAVLICDHRAEDFFHDCDRVLYLENGCQKFIIPPDKAASALRDNAQFDGLPCSYRLSAALDLESPLENVSDSRNFIRKNFKSKINENAKHYENAFVNLSDDKLAVLVKNVFYRYEKYGRDVICNMNFKAYFGEITAICGANGTGKSTLLKVAAGALKPQEGSVKICGKRISHYKNGSLYRGTVALLPQNPADIMLETSVYRDLLYSPDGEKRKDSEIFAVADSLGLNLGLLYSHPFDLSGGEIQRAALAKLLLLKPKILFLDEPDKGLDCVNKRLLSSLLRNIAEKGTAVIYVTHDLDFAAVSADKISLIFGGESVVTQNTERFLCESAVYTTAAARISKGTFCGIYTTEKLIATCLEHKGREVL